jgi:hypothetical protein
VYLAQREHMYNGLRLAGLPEGKEPTSFAPLIVQRN